MASALKNTTRVRDFSSVDVLVDGFLKRAAYPTIPDGVTQQEWDAFKRIPTDQETGKQLYGDVAERYRLKYPDINIGTPEDWRKNEALYKKVHGAMRAGVEKSAPAIENRGFWDVMGGYAGKEAIQGANLFSGAADAMGLKGVGQWIRDKKDVADEYYNGVIGRNNRTATADAAVELGGTAASAIAALYGIGGRPGRGVFSSGSKALRHLIPARYATPDVNLLASISGKMGGQGVLPASARVGAGVLSMPGAVASQIHGTLDDSHVDPDDTNFVTRMADAISLWGTKRMMVNGDDRAKERYLKARERYDKRYRPEGENDNIQAFMYRGQPVSLSDEYGRSGYDRPDGPKYLLVGNDNEQKRLEDYLDLVNRYGEAKASGFGSTWLGKALQYKTPDMDELPSLKIDPTQSTNLNGRFVGAVPAFQIRDGSGPSYRSWLERRGADLDERYGGSLAQRSADVATRALGQLRYRYAPALSSLEAIHSGISNRHPGEVAASLPWFILGRHPWWAAGASTVAGLAGDVAEPMLKDMHPGAMNNYADQVYGDQLVQANSASYGRAMPGYFSRLGR